MKSFIQTKSSNDRTYYEVSDCYYCCWKGESFDNLCYLVGPELYSAYHMTLFLHGKCTWVGFDGEGILSEYHVQTLCGLFSWHELAKAMHSTLLIFDLVIWEKIRLLDWTSTVLKRTLNYIKIYLSKTSHNFVYLLH